jgi:hypothetical protein
MSAAFNRNPIGRNQYRDVREYLVTMHYLVAKRRILAKEDDPTLVEALTALHRELLTDDRVVARLASEYNIVMLFVVPDSTLHVHS